eukprot:c22405_g1_i1 orf=90-1361(+)
MSTSELSVGVIIGISIGVAIGVLLAGCILLCIRTRKKKAQVQGAIEHKEMELPMRVNGADCSAILSDSFVGNSVLYPAKESTILPSLWGGAERNRVLSHSGVPKYSYRDLQKGTNNFTSQLGEGAFGPVYKANMPTGEIVAIKVLSSSSRQGDKEFLTEVTLLGRLHHRNLVNLVGYCSEKGHRMLIYEFMDNGSLAKHLYDEELEPLSWDQRVQIAQDVSRGIEYLHDGATPPVIHRDIKSANILLDREMRSRVADFGLSKEISAEPLTSGVRGTYGYVDPEYISTNRFTEKSDVYSFGVLLFELMTARNPQQGLMDYVNLAAMSIEGKEGWEEILDSRINGKYNAREVDAMASLANTCVNVSPNKRPRMRDIAQLLSKLGKRSSRSLLYRNLTLNGTDALNIELSRSEWSKLPSILERSDS